MNFKTMMDILQLAGTAAPAFKALFDATLPLFTSEEQEELKSTYAVARERSDAAHGALQDAACAR